MRLQRIERVAERITVRRQSVQFEVGKFFGIYPKHSNLMKDYRPARVFGKIMDDETDAVGRLVEKLGPKTYLDVGCGDGRFIQRAMPYAKKITGVDISEPDLGVVRKKFQSHISEGRLEVRRLDTVNEPLPSVDVVVCIGNTLNLFQPDLSNGVKKLLEAAGEEVVIILHSPAITNITLRDYRKNGYHVEDIHDGTVYCRIVPKEGGSSVFNSKKFRRDELETMLRGAEVPVGRYEISALDRYQWMVRIQKTLLNEEIKPELPPQAPKRSKIKAAAKFLGYAAYGLGLGLAFQYVFQHYGLGTGVLFSAFVGVVPTLFKKMIGKSGGKTSLLVSIDNIAGEFVFPTVVSTAAALSGFVHDPLSGFGVGLASAFAGYVVGVVSFYAAWGIANLAKYRQTGFGSLSDLRQLPGYVVDTIKNWKGRMSTPSKQIAAGSFLSEFAEMHGRALVCMSPYIALRVMAGLYAGFTPAAFTTAFIAVLTMAGPYISPVYATFYALVADRANSVVKKGVPTAGA